MRVETVPVVLEQSTGVLPTDWERHVAGLRAAEEPGDLRELDALLRTAALVDERGATWTYDGETWRRAGGAADEHGPPTTRLRLRGVELEIAVPDAGSAGIAVVPPAYAATHVVPPSGMPVWADPDPAAAPVAALDGGLDVMVTEARADGWARIVCSNEWSGWVDGALLVPLR